MAQLLKGLSAANALTDVLTERAAALHAKNVTPTLAILRVGERPDDISYETGAMKRCAKIGIAVRHFLLKADCTTDELLNTIREINEDPSIHGCLMFRPLPDKAMEEAACALLSPEKDVDCMTAASLTAVFTGNGAGYPPCTAQAVLELLDHYGIELSGKRVAVIGRSLVIGKPVSMMLQARNATVTMCHTKTLNLAQTCRDAEILVVAAGKAGIVDGSFAAPGQIIVDVGIHVNEEGKLCGDVLFDEAEPIAAAITPVPGGVGSVTTAVLAKHVIQAAEKTLL
ncbi:MAG: bifunctional 5,10-methylene-tetrahydrofolate dehydrogenase/5,10-methylene-tetrahydrofolate cyclohydrolase [Oscillospiraceae bacterium]|nr:bifunctional 5,10-methylene-tetrahydrofolate dehydrogenase/5,10-methylene-tetrahydrofolate cyclohydrolase [Oscillospiraceae bacterium]